MTDPRETAEQLAQEMASLYGPRLRSVVLYGSIPRGEAIAGVSDINLLVLLDLVDAAALRLGAPTARRWVEAGNSSPLLASWREWEESADAFAIEVADMRDAHVVLRGHDPIAHLPEDPVALRLQAERELRGKLVQLRTGLLLSAGKPDEIGTLLLRALPSFTTYCRAIIRLAGRTPPARSPETIEEAARIAGFDAAALAQAWQARAAARPIRAPLDSALTQGYYAAVVRATEYVDSLSKARNA
jgi:predicted nucleotidyltransferase